MVFPSYNFSDPAISYDTVESTVKDMYSYVVHRGTFQHNSDLVQSVIAKVDPILTVLEYDKAADQVRYQDDVQVAYQLLKLLV